MTRVADELRRTIADLFLTVAGAVGQRLLKSGENLAMTPKHGKSKNSGSIQTAPPHCRLTTFPNQQVTPSIR